MKKDDLQRMLTEAAGSMPTDDAFEFTTEDKASVLLATGGSVITLEEVGRVEIREVYVVISAARSDIYLIDLDKVLGIKIQRRRKGNAGFLPFVE